MKGEERKMFCPDCGAGNQNANAYCKRCGEWLSAQKSRRRQGPNTPEKRMAAMMVFNGLSAAFGLASAIALYASFGSPNAKVVMLVVASFCSVIAVHQTVSFFMAYQLMQRFKSGRGEKKQQDKLNVAGPSASIGSGDATEFINVGSVAENTTELLDAVPRVSKANDLR
jgi:hypothetical protein